MRATGLEAIVWEIWGGWQTLKTWLRLHRRVAVETREQYLPLGESQERQSQLRTLIPESAGNDRRCSAPKSETMTPQLRTKIASKCLFCSAAPTTAFLGMQGVGERTRVCPRHFRLAWQPLDLCQGPVGATRDEQIWKELSYQVAGQVFSYISRAEVCPSDS